MLRVISDTLLCSLTILAMSACVELDSGIDFREATDLPQTFNKEANDDRPSATNEPVRIVYATPPAGETPLLTFPEPLAMILIDRTGSMIATRETTHNTRCLDAVTQAETQVAELSNSGAKSFAVWTFTGSTVVQRVTYVSKDTALAVIASLRTETCAGSTPLAFAMCAAAQNLAQNRALPGNKAFLSISTDGGENNSAAAPLLTIGNTNCSGPEGDISTPGTWQNKVQTYINTTIGNIKVDNTYWKGSNVVALTGDRVLSAAAPGCSPSVQGQCDEALLGSLSNVTGGNFRKAADNTADYPCSAGSCPVPDTNSVGSRFAFTAINTNDGTINTANHSIFLFARETINVGTCGITGSSGSGDTVLRLLNPTGAQVALNDDSCGTLSNFSYTAPADGVYLITAGCFSINGCSGTVAFTVQGSLTYGASNTNNATINTVNRNVQLRPSQNIVLGTCGVTGASGVGNSFLRLFDRSGVNVAFNDDSCGALSRISYNVASGAGGTHQIRAGCSANTSCSGTIAYLITQP